MKEECEAKMTIWDAWAECRIKPTPVGTPKTPHNPPDPHTIPSFGDIVALTEEGRKEAAWANPESLVGLALKGEDLTTQGKVIYRSQSGYWIECTNDEFETCLVRPWNLINYGPEPDPYYEGWKGEAK